MTIETAWNGHYWRDRSGTWHYSISGEPVPGGRDRRILDGRASFSREAIDGIVYAAVPAADAQEAPDLAALCTREGVLAETVDGALLRFLVPEALLPSEPHPEGGMWAPELERQRLLVSSDLQARLGFAAQKSIWDAVDQGRLPQPVIELPVELYNGRIRHFWTVPIIEQWLPRYRAVKPLHYNLAKKMATQRARRAAGLPPVHQRGRKKRGA